MNPKSLYKNLPSAPGVYLMKNKGGEIIYVGKAGNLKRRVSSYFLRPHDRRIETLVSEIAAIEHQETDSALEALILEARLIKQYEPKYNIKDKDDKSFLYVEITRDEFPRVLLARGGKKGVSDARGGRYPRFGPFVSASSIRAALSIIRKIFPWSDHPSPVGYGVASHPTNLLGFNPNRLGRPCFNYQIGLCPGTCVGAITKKDYAKIIARLKLFFRGEKKKIIRDLEKEMRERSAAEEFEKSEMLKRKIFALQHIQDIALIGENETTSSRDNAFDAAEDTRIEGYDISNISGAAAVGAMVVFVNNKPVKSEYRLFNIKTIVKPNDTGMMKEVLERRLRNTWPLPHLILVDGGVGQITVARGACRKAGARIPIVGLAKGKSRKDNRFIGVVPDFTDEITLLRVRDEAHRFSRAHHTRLRSRNFWG